MTKRNPYDASLGGSKAVIKKIISAKVRDKNPYATAILKIKTVKK